MKTEIVIPHASPSLNEVNKLNWRKRDALRKRYEKIVWASTRNQHPGPVRLEVYRHTGYGFLDDDNFRGGMKQFLDALKNQKVIVDDKDTVIVERHYEQVKISRAQPKMTVVIIKDM